jgi:hypothetical protein
LRGQPPPRAQPPRAQPAVEPPRFQIPPRVNRGQRFEDAFPPYEPEGRQAAQAQNAEANAVIYGEMLTRLSNAVKNEETALEGIRLVEPHIRQIRAGLESGQLNKSEYRKLFRSALLKYHPDKGGDEAIFSALSNILGIEDGINLWGQGKSRRCKKCGKRKIA